MNQYRLVSTSMFHVPGLIKWFLAVRKGNVKGARSDKAARVHFIKATWPSLPDAAINKILASDYTVEGEDVIVTA